MTIHDSDRDFDQFRHFDRPMSPSAATLSALRNRLASTAETGATSASSQVVSESSSIAPAPSESWTDSVHRRRVRTWQLAAAILAILLAASTLVISLQPEEPTRLAFQPMDQGDSGDVNYAGTPGRTWEVSDRAPVVGEPTAVEMPHTEFGSGPSLMVNGSLITSRFNQQRPAWELLRVNLTASREIWSVPMSVSGTMASDGELLFILTGLGPSSGKQSQLLALDVETGETIWEGPALASRTGEAGSIVVDGGEVFVTDFLGNAAAVDAKTGATKWQFPEVFRESTNAEVYRLETGPSWGFATPVVSVTDDMIYVVRPSRTVVALDRSTGNQLDSINVIDDYSSGAEYVDVIATATRLVIVASHMYAPNPVASIEESTLRADVLVFDRQSLSLEWQRPVSSLLGNIVLSEGTLYIPQSAYDPTATNSPNNTQILPVDLDSMWTGQPVKEWGTGTWVNQSVAGNVLMIATEPGIVSFVDLSTSTLINQVEIPIDRAAFGFSGPVLLAGSTPLVTSYSGDVVLLGQSAPEKTYVEVNPAGTAGKTWQVSDQNPVVGSPVWSTHSPAIMDLAGTIVVDGSVIVNMFATEDQARTLARLDLQTGEILWQSNLVVTGIYAADDQSVFGFWIPDPNKPNETQLLAIDHGTGEVAWRGPILAERERTLGPNATALVDGDTVYALDFLGNLVSVDAATGAQNWQFPEQFRTPGGADDETSDGTFLLPQLAIDQKSVFFVRSDQSVVKVSRDSGKQVGIINVIDDYATMSRHVNVAVSESFLLVMALAPTEVIDSTYVRYWEDPTELLVFDRHTLDLVGRASIPDLRGMVAIQGDTAFVPQSDGDPFNRSDNSWNPKSRIDAIDLESLTVTSQIVGIDEGRQLLLSLAGTTLIVPRATGTIDFHTLPSLQKTNSVTIDVPESEYAFLFPVQMNGTTPVVIGSIGEIYLLNGPPLAATPEAVGTPVP